MVAGTVTAVIVMHGGGCALRTGRLPAPGLLGEPLVVVVGPRRIPLDPRLKIILFQGSAGFLPVGVSGLILSVATRRRRSRRARAIYVRAGRPRRNHRNACNQNSF